MGEERPQEDVLPEDVPTERAWRKGKIEEIFHVLDERGEGRLGMVQLSRFVYLCGFNLHEWEHEYEDMCTENGWSGEAGLDLGQFERLVDDVSILQGRAYCNDTHLVEILEKLHPT